LSGSQNKVPGSAGVIFATAWFCEGELLGVHKLAWAFFECSIYRLNSKQMRHKGGSKLPHCKAPSARDRETMRYWARRRCSKFSGPGHSAMSLFIPEFNHGCSNAYGIKYVQFSGGKKDTSHEKNHLLLFVFADCTASDSE
jgi:hypothetical protein